jgi:hypothetical protein
MVTQADISWIHAGDGVFQMADSLCASSHGGSWGGSDGLGFVTFIVPQKVNMTGIEAFDSIVDSLKDQRRRQPTTPPTLLRVPWGTAYDLAKLGRAELGDLGDKILTEGVGVLERQGFRGFKVEIDWKNQYGDILAT